MYACHDYKNVTCNIFEFQEIFPKYLVIPPQFGGFWGLFLSTGRSINGWKTERMCGGLFVEDIRDKSLQTLIIASL